MKRLWGILLLFAWIFTSCDILTQLESTAAGPKPLTTLDITQGLKEALQVGVNNSVSLLSKENGFYGNPGFRIPFPEEAKIVEEKLRQIGMDKMVDDFVLTLNRGAEKAVQKATPVFVGAIKQMSFSDARSILQGPDNAATDYFRKTTSRQLVTAFKPDIQTTLDEVNVTKYWGQIMSTYNKIPFVQKVETDLSQYVTEKTVNALFSQVEKEEKLIRTDPKARVTEILRKVFGQKNGY